MRKDKRVVVNAIRSAIKELSCPFDASIADKSVVVGDPWGWGAEVATIHTEHGLEFLDYYGADWIGNSIKIQNYVKAKTGLSIFIECYNPAIHNVYWN